MCCVVVVCAMLLRLYHVVVVVICENGCVCECQRYLGWTEECGYMLCGMVSFSCVVVHIYVYMYTCICVYIYVPSSEMVVCVGVRGWTEEGGASTPS